MAGKQEYVMRWIIDPHDWKDCGALQSEYSHGNTTRQEARVLLKLCDPTLGQAAHIQRNTLDWSGWVKRVMSRPIWQWDLRGRPPANRSTAR